MVAFPDGTTRKLHEPWRSKLDEAERRYRDAKNEETGPSRIPAHVEDILGPCAEVQVTAGVARATGVRDRPALSDPVEGSGKGMEPPPSPWGHSARCPQREWFFEERNGNCRLMADLASDLFPDAAHLA